MGERQGFGQRVLNGIERAGNALPDPATLFLFAIILLMVVSAIMAGAGVTAMHPGTKQEVAAVSLLSGPNIQRLFNDLPLIFANFPPLALVLIVMMGVGIAERTGLIATALGGLVRAVPKSLLTLAVVFAGVQASLAADAGYVVLTPLAAAIFYSVGRHPIAGLAAAFAGVSAGFSANLLITALDPLLAGISTAAAQIIAPDYVVPITANYFLMIAFVPLFTVLGWIVTDRIVEPRLMRTAPVTGDVPRMELNPDAEESARARRGLIWAGLVFVALVVLFAWMVVPEGAVFRDADGGIGPFLGSLDAILFVAFALCGIAYGIGYGSIKSDKDVVGMMSKTMSDMGGYIILAFAAAVFIALFAWSNLGAILAINGAELLQAAGFVGLPLLVAMILVSAGINILVGSASAKWAILAPVLVPMLMLVGISPEATQAAYRVGDAATNPITPLLPYFPLILIMCQRYVPGFGIGSLVATMLPYSVWFGIGSAVLFGLWFGLDLPFGPGSYGTIPVPGAG